MTKEPIRGANDLRATHFPWFAEENLEANVTLVSQFKAFTDKKECTASQSASQLAITWLLKRGL